MGRQALMFISKRAGENTEPWGTPAFTRRDFESAPLLRKLEILFHRLG